MRKYETIVVFNSDLNESALKEEVLRIENLLKSEYHAETVTTAFWGKKEISYTVGRQKFGHFVCVTFATADNRAVENLSRMLSITDSVLKFHTSRIQEKTRKFKGSVKRRTSEVGEEEFGGVSEAEF